MTAFHDLFDDFRGLEQDLVNLAIQYVETTDLYTWQRFGWGESWTEQQIEECSKGADGGGTRSGQPGDTVRGNHRPVYMTEIQLRRIVDRTAKEQQAHQSDGDETTTKNGKTISKNSKEAMNIGEDALEHEVVLRKVYLVYDKWVGNDSVFPLSNGAPKIMTKFKDKP
jgi:hypothetical protein